MDKHRLLRNVRRSTWLVLLLALAPGSGFAAEGRGRCWSACGVLGSPELASRVCVGRGFVASPRLTDLLLLTATQARRDLDADGIPDVFDPDNDGDGLTDLDEILHRGTAADNADTDGDGMGDGWELQHGLNPALAGDGDLDPDGDGWSNRMEAELDSDPNDYVLQLKPGWNLIALARKPRDSTVTALLAGQPIILPVWRWDGTHYLPADELLPQVGYWLYAEEAAEVQIGLP